MAVTIKTKEEIALIREGGARLAAILRELVAEVSPGVSTAELDAHAERLILSCGGAPAFKGYRIREASVAYPASICISVNDEVVHAIPHRDKILKSGDVTSIDIGMRWPADGKQEARSKKQGSGGLFTDMAVTIGVGKISAEAARLIRATREALDIGIAAAVPSARVGDIGYAIQQHLQHHHLGIIRDLAGHGTGYKLHEEPLISNYGKRGSGVELKEGMVIAIEPMATLGGEGIILDDDEWTFRTSDSSLAAHFEHTIVVTKDGSEVLTQ